MTTPDTNVGREHDSKLLSACYLAMRDAMQVIDPEEGPGREHSRVLNALADCRVQIENRNALVAGLTSNEFGLPIATLRTPTSARGYGYRASDTMIDDAQAAFDLWAIRGRGGKIKNHREAIAKAVAAAFAQAQEPDAYMDHRGVCIAAELRDAVPKYAELYTRPLYAAPALTEAAQPKASVGRVTDEMANRLLDYVPFPNDQNYNFCLGWLLSSHPAFYKDRNVGQLGLELMRVSKAALTAALSMQDAGEGEDDDAEPELDDLVGKLVNTFPIVQIVQAFDRAEPGLRDFFRHATLAIVPSRPAARQPSWEVVAWAVRDHSDGSLWGFTKKREEAAINAEHCDDTLVPLYTLDDAGEK